MFHGLGCDFVVCDIAPYWRSYCIHFITCTCIYLDSNETYVGRLPKYLYFRHNQFFSLLWRGSVYDLSFFSESILFLLIEFHCIFSISYKILTNYVYYYYYYYYCILIRIVWAVWTSFFFRTRVASFRTHASLLTFFVCFLILFYSCCSHERVFRKTLVSSPFPIAILNCDCFFPTVQLQVYNMHSERKRVK